MYVHSRVYWSMRHIRHLTRFTYERERMGKSPYLTRKTRFRHLTERKNEH